jgi:hypothetical protein
MALPSSRAEFKNYCLRRLGAPVIQINLDDMQIEDRIDEALWFYRHNHYNGSEKVYLSIPVSQANISQGYIDLSGYGDIIGVTKMFRVGNMATNNLLSIDFAVSNQAMYQALQGNGMLSYAMLMSYRSLIEELTIGDKMIRFNEFQNRVYIDMNWHLVGESQYIIIECVRSMDDTLFSDMWQDKWIQEYATQLIKRNWGEVLKKYAGATLPGGITLDGKTIYDEAHTKIEEMEEKAKDDFTLPPDMMIG